MALAPESGKDWNDICREQGVDAVRRGIEGAVARPPLPELCGTLVCRDQEHVDVDPPRVHDDQIYPSVRLSAPRTSC